VRSPSAIVIDALGKRYGQLPSRIVGFEDGAKALLFNIAVLKAGLQAESEAPTTKGSIQSKRAKWDPEMIEELRRQGQWR